MPLLGRRRSSAGGGGGGGLADDESGHSSQPEPAGPPMAGSQEDVRSGSTGSLRPRSRQDGSLLDMTGDHFSWGEIVGAARPSSAGGLLHSEHQFYNRGRGLWAEERERLKLPALVDTGRHAGRSRVEYRSTTLALGWHLLHRDFFVTMLQTPFVVLASWIAALYLTVYLSWGFIWWLVVKYYSGCIYGATTYVESFVFAIITQMTIGYGNTGPQKCWVAAWLICTQSIGNVLLNAIVLGLMFAKVASPKFRAHSIYISDSAVIARRDGILKFMFRVADVRRTQVIEPKVKAFLYTWGEGRYTAEGEFIPVRCEPLDLAYIDGMLLLPLIIEHTIDERSPLCGHTYDSLAAMHAEIVVTFEATTEMGNPFYARQSYLAQEISWGGQFVEIIRTPPAGTDDPHYAVALDSFHDVRCPLVEAEDDDEARSQASQNVVHRAKRAVPYPLLGENTLVLSDLLCVRPVAGGRGDRMELVCRVADTYPSQMLDITARIYLYRWRPVEWCRAHPSLPSFTLHALECGYKKGTDKLHLRLPQEVVHRIGPSSPLASWLEPGGLSADADSEIVVVLQCYLYQTSQNRMRQRTYRVGSHVRYGFTFTKCVRPPAESRDGKPRVRWSHFFDVEPVGWGEGGRGGPTIHLHAAALRHPAVQAYLSRRTTLTAPESHAQTRAQQDRNPTIDRALNTPRSARSWVPPGLAGGAAAWARQPFGPPPRDEAAAPEAEEAAGARAGEAAGAAVAAGEAAAAAGAAAEQLAAVSRGVLGEEEEEQLARTAAGPLAAATVAPELAAAAEAVGPEAVDMPGSPLSRYKAAMDRPTALPPLTVQALQRQMVQQAAVAPLTPAVGAALPAALPAAAAAAPAAELAPHAAAVPPPPGAAALPPASLAGPPDLGAISAVPSLSLERYETSLTWPSYEDAPGSASMPLPPPAAAGLAPPHSGGGGAAAGSLEGSREGSGRSTASGSSRAGSAPATPAVAGELGLAAQQAQQAQQRLEAEQPAAWGQAAQWQGEPDVMPADFTVTPSVDLSRYEAFLTTGDVSPTAQQAQQAQQFGSLPEAGHPPLAPRQHGVAFDVPAGAGRARPQPRGVDREPSWHKSRSLAALQSIFEHPEPDGEEEEEEEEHEGHLQPGGASH